MATYHKSQKPSKLDKQDMQDTAGGARTNAWDMFFYGPFYTDMQLLDNQLELIYNSSVRTQDGARKTCWKWWMIETDGESEREKSVQAAWHNDVCTCPIL